jgi:hypothetical protein
MAKKFKKTDKPKAVKAEKYHQLGEDTIAEFERLYDKISLPFKLRIKYIGQSDLKSLVKLKRVTGEWKFVTELDLIVFINEKMMDDLDEQNREVLVLQELEKLSVDIDKGEIKLSKPDLTTFSSLIKKYGIDIVAKANNLSELTLSQYADNSEASGVEFVTAK